MVILFLIAFFYRVKGIFANNPFWVDEFSTAKAARYILHYGLGYFTNSNIDFETHNITTYFLTALSFKLFGQSEWVARLPFVIIGSILPIAVYVLGKKIFGKTTAICASLLTTFSYLMIVWSRQSREYVLLQLLTVLSIYFYVKVLEEKKVFIWNYIALIGCIILAVLTHLMTYILLGSLVIHFTCYKKKWIKKNITLPKYFTSLLLASLIFVLILDKQGVLNYLKNNFSLVNNVWYYHSFFWREYGLITFLGLSGLILGLLKKNREVSILLLYIVFQLLFINFIWGHRMIKYSLTIFPLLFIGVGYFITEIARLVISKENLKETLREKLKFFLPISIIILIIANGNKFVIKPKAYYSVNEDFRELANIDYNIVYSIIKNKGQLDKEETAIVETWSDRAQWYLGNDFKNIYLFRWQDEGGVVNGHLRITPFTYNKDGEKIRATKEKIKFIGKLTDLKKALSKYPRGFFFIDDRSYPKEVIDYVEKNFKKELYIDHYTLDDNPYSIWPATLYSWGI